MRLKNRGRYLTQWDKSQVIIVDEYPPGTQVHFFNRKMQEAYVLNVDSNHEVQIPDILLQYPYPLMVYIYVEDSGMYYSVTRREFQVIARTRPESYIYTEEEHAYWETKVDKDWGVENAGHFLSIGADGKVTLSEVTDVTMSDKYFQFTQNVASDVWEINHNLDKNPSVSVVDSAGTIIVGEVNYIDTNNLTITFQAAFSGKAYLN